MKITVIGSGYVGLVTGCCFAEMGNIVICIDNNKDKLNKLKSKILPIYEPHLENIFERNIDNGNLHFSQDLKEGIEHSNIIFLALPTPPNEDGSADLKYILGVSEEIGKITKDLKNKEYRIFVNKSTVPVGTAEKVKSVLSKYLDYDFDVVSNPEFLREGFAVDDFLKPDRVIIGSTSEKAIELMTRLYKPFMKQGNPIIIMDERSSELTKYAANSYLATRISFMNEIANICEKVGANVDLVRIGMGSDQRIGKRFLFPGIGYGGSCFPKDVLALVNTAKQYDYDFKILDSVEKVNNSQKLSIIPKLKNYFKNKLENKKIAIWGLSFKPETDDIREAPSLYIIKELLNEKAIVNVYDPEAMENTKNIFKDKINYAKNHLEALNDADALLILTEWSLFRTIDITEIKKHMKNLAIFDGRNTYDLNEIKNSGIYYESVGRPKILN